MTTLRRLKDVVALEQFAMVLQKTETQPEIAKALKKFGYTAAVLKEGKAKLQGAREKYEESVKAKDAYNTVKSDMEEKRLETARNYRLHRRVAKIMYHDDQNLRAKLSIDKKYPTDYFKWLDAIRKFYNEGLDNPDILEKMQGMGLKKEDLEKGQANVHHLEDFLAAKMRFRGDTRLATAEKNKAFKALHQWMRLFHNTAKLALKDQPTLLESLDRHFAS